MKVTSIRFPKTTSLAIKPMSTEGSQRIIKAGIHYAIKHNKPIVTIVHKGNIQKYTEGKFRDTAYNLAETEFAGLVFTQRQFDEIKSSQGLKSAERARKENANSGKVFINDCIADAFFQNALLRPEQFSVVITSNLNGDYISDALAAQVGGIGISPGANINYQTGYAIFEATHGTAPTIAGQKKANPCALLLSGVMLFRYLKWHEVADAIENSIEKTISKKTVTADFNMPKAIIKNTFEFADEIIKHL